MTRAVNDTTLADLKKWEALALVGYADEKGVPTIGYGHTGPGVAVGQICTEDEADIWLSQDIAWAAACVETHVAVPLTDNQFGALVSFCFNVGPGGKTPGDGFTTSTLLTRLNAGDYACVPAQLAKWNHENGKVSNGLTNRRAVEAALWVAGQHVASASTSPTVAPTPLFTAPNITKASVVVIPMVTTWAATEGPMRIAAGVIVSVSALVAGVMAIMERRAKQS